MTLSKKVERYFSAATKKKGQPYFWQRRVVIVQATDDAVKAEVTGSGSVYEVNLSWQSPTLLVSCTCPYFEQYEACKHIWATILMADDRKLLPNAAAAANVTVEEDILEDNDFEDDEEEIAEFQLRAPEFGANRVTHGVRAPEVAAWRKEVASLVQRKALGDSHNLKWPEKKEIVYQVDVQGSAVSGDVILTLASRERKADGNFSSPAKLNMKRGHIPQLPLAEDREIISAILGGQHYYGFGDSGSYLQIQESALLTEALAATVMPRVFATGRCYLKLYKPEENPQPIQWDAGEPWRFELELKTRSSKGWALTGVLRRGEERLALPDTVLITRTMVFTKTRAAWLEVGTAREWIMHMHNMGAIVAPERDVQDMLAELLKLPGLPPVSVSEELNYEEVHPQPKPSLKILAQRSSGQMKEKLRAALLFDYEGWAAAATEESRGFYDAERRRYIKRDPGAESQASEMLKGLGFKRQTAAYLSDGGSWELAPSKLPKAVRTLMEAGWHVEAEGKMFRRPGARRMDIASGVDWFELHGEVQYGETTARLPELLEALRRGDNVVRLGDGTFGVLPEEWLERIGALAGLGSLEDGHVRFRKNQAGLLDALLATQPETSCDAVFATVREELGRFEGVTPAEQPDGFVGQLRDYQREGLGWMNFLRRFSFGGCLADDMGVGKTAQVLALLEDRRILRARGELTKPSLVVVPRSLIFNWKEEAARFTPQLRVLDYSGAERNTGDLSGYDLILATYGTLRRDIPRMKDIEFDYVVLDEAQAIKNADTESAKATRLLRGDHRLALSGTPVENHIGELFSLFEFLNPGMLGTASVFKLSGTAREEFKRGDARNAYACVTAFHSPAHEGAGGARTAGEDRADYLLRDGA